MKPSPTAMNHFSLRLQQKQDKQEGPRNGHPLRDDVCRPPPAGDDRVLADQVPRPGQPDPHPQDEGSGGIVRPHSQRVQRSHLVQHLQEDQGRFHKRKKYSINFTLLIFTLKKNIFIVPSSTNRSCLLMILRTVTTRFWRFYVTLKCSHLSLDLPSWRIKTVRHKARPGLQNNKLWNFQINQRLRTLLRHSYCIYRLCRPMPQKSSISMSLFPPGEKVKCLGSNYYFLIPLYTLIIFQEENWELVRGPIFFVQW